MIRKRLMAIIKTQMQEKRAGLVVEIIYKFNFGVLSLRCLWDRKVKLFIGQLGIRKKA